MSMKINRDYRHIQLPYQTNYRRLPLTVFYPETPIQFRHGTGREKAQWMAVPHVQHSLFDSFHRRKTFFRIVRSHRINCNEIRAHATYGIKYHIHHHLIIRSARRHNVNQHYSVQCSERMIGNRYERPLRQIFKYRSICNPLSYTEIIKQSPDKSFPRGIKVAMMEIIHIIHLQPFHYFSHKMRTAFKKWNHFTEVLIIKNCPLLRFVGAIILRGMSEYMPMFVDSGSRTVRIIRERFRRSFSPPDYQFICFCIFKKLHFSVI